MLDFIKRAVKQRRGDRGASAVEYGLLIAAIAAVIMVIAFALGNTLQSSFQDTCDKIATTASEADPECAGEGTGS